MPLELDHFFICTPDASAAEDALVEFGLHFGGRGVHRGQGTSSAGAFFDNAYLEIICRRDDAELQSDLVRPVGLWERLRWQETGASPFGISFRPVGDAALSPDVETWPYAAPYLPPGAHIPIITPRHAWREPLIFLSTVSQAPSSLPPERRPPLEQRGHRRRITATRLTQPHIADHSAGLRTLCEAGLLTIDEAPEPHAEMEWDGGLAGESHDFRPILPLTIRW